MSFASVDVMKTNGYFSDPVAKAYENLGKLDGCVLIQGRAVLEGFTGGVMPNKYTMCDPSTIHVSRHMDGTPKEGYDIEKPLFIVEEDSDGCCTADCWCRICCSPKHPSITKLYVATEPQPVPDTACFGCTCASYSDKSYKDGPAFMTFERFGCCTRWANCFVCCEQCQDEMRIHAGDVGGNVNGQWVPSPLNDQTCILMDKVPIGGGACTPTIEMYERIGPGVITEATQDSVMQKFGVVEGPTCFGGCYDWCCDTPFYVSTAAGLNDIAEIRKKKPEDCDGFCRACCTTADTYKLTFTEQGKQWPPEKKAMTMANMVHLDYMFFEEDRFPVTCEHSDNGTMIYILCCLCYCYGCLCPIECCIFLPKNQDN